ncbi:GNAT family N-acetyltransferase [Niveispirillum sp. BGYR6]|uniref:GNAT family N-acetyltransferase n=1 Tax=Niveispirillum sp. BGYR6 TaxID=2971249 RepID=UPI0022B99434|nr:GNAT family N-acetyltransferase [Niveispirillum sp. BGYR6]MDG5495232.1 GNAT family N-acetyltransferase [Niveispirillum sp. BGYR6]
MELDIGRIQSLEDLCLSAWPAPQQLHHAGWVLRFAAGHTGRANSTNAVALQQEISGDLFPLVEREYRRRGLRPTFRETPLCPSGFSAALLDEGYLADDESHVMVAEIPAGCVPDPSVRLQNNADDAWLAAYRSMVPIAEAEMPALRSILAGIAASTRYLTLWSDGRPVAAGLGVIDRGWVGLYKIATHPQARGQGHAGRLIRALYAEAAGQGATKAYLQVGVGNQPALALYRRLGFTPLYNYRYYRKG